MEEYSGSWLLGLIVGCEIAFWVVLASGLVARYLLRWPRTGAALLMGVPLIDLVLLGAAVADLRLGAYATSAHGLAAVYIGFAVACGGPAIRWADGWFAHRFAGAGPPPKPPGYGWPNFVYELKWWGRCLGAVAIVYALLVAMIALVDQPERTEALELWFKIPLGTVFFWFLGGPVWSALFRRKPPGG